jgi:hypothetical protein
VTVQAGSKPSTGSTRAKSAARRLAQAPLAILPEQKVVMVMRVHDASEEGPGRAPNANLGCEGREIVCTTEDVLMACDPAPWRSQTPTTAAMQSNEGGMYLFVGGILRNRVKISAAFK